MAARKSHSDFEYLAEFNQAIISGMHEGLVVADVDGVFQLVNPAAAQMLGYAPYELVGKHQNCVVPDDQVSTIIAADERRDRGKSDTYDLVLAAKDGARVNVRVAGSPLLLGGKYAGTIAMFTDLREQRRGEIERDHLQGQLRQAHKMEALGLLAGGMAHDFNNILQVIVGFTDLAMAELATGSSPIRSLDEVLKASDRARQLVKQVMSFSRRSEDTLQPLLLCPVVEESLRLLRSTLPSTVEIRSTICSDCGPISGNATLVQQVLLNLGANANQAMEEGGGLFEVTVETTTVGADRARQHRNLREGEYVRMTVSDTGKGMDAATLERIFEPYFTTKERGEGTGLGLAVVHGIVNQLDGVIAVESTSDVGTTFEIFFPSLPHTPATTDELAREDIRGGEESILIVDDEPQIVDATNLQLEQLGYRVTAVGRSDEALRLIETQPDAFDLLITDQTMPGMTGAELAERVQQIRPDLPVILCTGYDSALEDEYPEKPRIDALLAKPISRAELATAVRAALE